MSWRRKFNHLSGWIVNLPSSFNPDHRSRFIQRDALLGFLVKFYRTQENVQSFDTIPIRHYRPVRRHVPESMKHEFIKMLDSQHPGLAKLEMVQGGLWKSNSELADLPERQGLINKVMAVEFLLNKGLSGTALDLYTGFINDCVPDQAFIEEERKRMDRVISGFLAEEKSTLLIQAMCLRCRCHKDNMAQQYHLRLRFMQLLADHIADAFEHPRVPVFLDEFPDHLKRIAAYAVSKEWVGEHGAVLVNAGAGTIDDIPTMVNLVAHEMRHLMDFTLSERLKRGKLPCLHKDFAHAAMISLNNAAYADYPLGKVTDAQDRERRIVNYRLQYMERAARRFAEYIEHGVKTHLPCIPDMRYEIQNISMHSMH